MPILYLIQVAYYVLNNIQGSLGDEQYKRLMAYMKALQKLEEMESIVEE